MAGLATDRGHRLTVDRPDDNDRDPIGAAESTAAQLSSREAPLGRSGSPLNRYSPFMLGVTASAGVAVTFIVVRALEAVSPMLLLVGVAFFLALGLEPGVSWLRGKGLPRWAAVTAVLVTVAAVLAGTLAAAIPPLVRQARFFLDQAPNYIHHVDDHSSWIGKFNSYFHVQRRIAELVNSSGGPVLTDAAKAGTAVFGVVADLVVVAALTVYFLVDLPRIRATLYRLVPHSRRPRAILIGDEVYAKVGAYVFGNVVVSGVAGAATCIWLLIFHVPYPLLLAVFVALVDLIPFGSTVAGFVVAAIALTVSVPTAVATLVFYLVFRLAEDYLLIPKVIGKAVQVPAVVTLLAVLLGGALLGIVGALVAIPVAAAVQLCAQEILFPKLDQS